MHDSYYTAFNFWGTLSIFIRVIWLGSWVDCVDLCVNLCWLCWIVYTQIGESH